MLGTTLNKTTILVIDDDPMVHKVVEASLLKDGYHFEFASDGKSGIAKALEQMPDLVLLDVVMPGMDGFEVCVEFRKNEQLRNLPIIIFTALDDKDSKVQGLNAGADDYICKPFDKLEFRTRVRTITRMYRNSQLGTIEQLMQQIEVLQHQLATKDDEMNGLKNELLKFTT